MASPRPSTAAPPPSHPAHTLLARAHSPDTATRLFTEKVAHKPLLLRASSPPAFADKRALRRHVRLKKKEYYLRKQKPRPLSAKEKRALGVHDLNVGEDGKGEISYEVYEGLNRLWRGYIREVLGIGLGGTTKQITAAGHGPLLASADFHGAEIEVVRSGCVGRVGTRGIVVRDTKFTFVVVCKGDMVRQVPKNGCVFRVRVGSDDEASEGRGVAEETYGEGKYTDLIFEIHGSQFEVRPADRANKKFKWNVKDYL